MRNFAGVPKIVQGKSDNEYIILFPSGDGLNFYTTFLGFAALNFLFLEEELIDRAAYQRLREEVRQLPIPWSVDVSAKLEQVIEELAAANAKIAKMDETITFMAAEGLGQGADTTALELSEADDCESTGPVSKSVH